MGAGGGAAAAAGGESDGSLSAIFFLSSRNKGIDDIKIVDHPESILE